MAQIAEQKKEDSKLLAVFPCVLTPVAVFNKKDPIVVGVDVTEGNLHLLTPIAAIRTNPITNVKEVISMGRVYVLFFRFSKPLFSVFSLALSSHIHIHTLSLTHSLSLLPNIAPHLNYPINASKQLLNRTRPQTSLHLQEGPTVCCRQD